MWRMAAARFQAAATNEDNTTVAVSTWRSCVVLLACVALCSGLVTESITTTTTTTTTKVQPTNNTANYTNVTSAGAGLTMTSLPYDVTEEHSANPTTAASDAVNYGHKLPCNETERLKSKCGQQGQCYVLEAMRRQTFCMCQTGWDGSRCLTKTMPVLDGTASAGLTTNGIIVIAVGLLFAVLLAVVSCVVFVVVRRLRVYRRVDSGT